MSYRFGIAIVVYATLAMLVGSLFTRCHPQGHYIAATTLVKNHRIAAGDLRRPSEWPFSAGWYLPDRGAMEGNYVISDTINACDPVAGSSVEFSPDLQAGAGLKLVALPLPVGSQLARVLDAGSVVEVLLSQKPAAEHANPNPEEKSKAGEKKEMTKTGRISKEKKSDGSGDSSIQATKTATVHAILCDAPTGQDKNPPACYALLAVPAEIEEYVAKQKDSIRLAPKTIRARDACKKGENRASANMAKDHRAKENP